MKPIIFSKHALEQMPDRGTIVEEVEATIITGESTPAKGGRLAFRKNFPFHKKWRGHRYGVKQVMPIVTEESDKMVVVTVYVFYFGGVK